jgi:hypothetical protein
LIVPLTDQQRQLALSIDRFVQVTLQRGGGDEALLAQAFDYMPAIKQLLDTTTHEQMNQLAQSPLVSIALQSC